MRKNLSTLLLLLCIIFSFNACGEKKKDEVITNGIIRVSFNQSITHPHIQTLMSAGKKFEEATEGRFKFLVYPNEVLGDHRATLELIQHGGIQMAIISNAVLENFNKDFGILGLPYVFDSEEHQKKVFLSNSLEELYTSLHKDGFEIIATYTAGSRNIYTTKPIEKPEDLKGFKIRVMESPTMVSTINLMGGVGTPMGQGEVYTSIQQKVLDGGENNEITYHDLKHYEVAPYFSATKHLMVPDVVIIEKEYIDRMTEKDRTILKEIFHASIEEEFELWGSEVEKAKKAAMEHGVIFTEVDIKPFQENVKSMHEGVIKNSDVMKRLYQKIRDFV